MPADLRPVIRFRPLHCDQPQRDPQAADDLLPLDFDRLRRQAAERPGQSLQATALVHEA
jgi:hypothetical protein